VYPGPPKKLTVRASPLLMVERAVISSSRMPRPSPSHARNKQGGPVAGRSPELNVMLPRALPGLDLYGRAVTAPPSLPGLLGDDGERDRGVWGGVGPGDVIKVLICDNTKALVNGSDPLEPRITRSHSAHRPRRRSVSRLNRGACFDSTESLGQPRHARNPGGKASGKPESLPRENRQEPSPGHGDRYAVGCRGGPWLAPSL
jgi:hypothetical protein